MELATDETKSWSKLNITDNHINTYTTLQIR